VAPASSDTDDAGDAGDPVGLDLAILWHSAANRLTWAPQQAAALAPPLVGVAAPAPARQWFGIHYSRRPAPPPASQPPQAAPSAPP